MRVLVIDNYDSFTHNLVQMLEARGAVCDVRRCDSVTVAEALALGPRRIVLSPGPFGPERTGICADLIGAVDPDVPVLGVCLGMQVIAATAGAAVVPSGRPVHGKVRTVVHDGTGVLRDVPSPLEVGLYHSLVVAPDAVPEDLEVFATEDPGGTIMGCRLRGRPVEGLLFHPESFLTPEGDRILATFLEGIDVVGRS